MLSRRFCLTHTSGEDIYLYTLRNAKGTELRITNYGAIITAFRVRNKEGSFNDIVLGFDKIEDYWSPVYLSQHPWFGCAVGRFANRIKNASFELDGKKYELARNHGNEHLHGGIDGFDKKVWKFIASGESPQPFLELSYTSSDGEEGYPGNLETVIRFELNDADELSYTYRAMTDKATPVNLTHHDYFNLDNGQGTIREHEIKINASHFLEQEKNLVVTGKLLPVNGTAYDLREFRKISEGLKKLEEYDTSFVLDLPGSSAPVLVAEARSKRSGLHLQVYSTEPIVHFYSGKWIPSVIGKNQTLYGPFSGFCLETHKHPNAVNLPHFPNTILQPGEEYFQKTIYKVLI